MKKILFTLLFALLFSSTLQLFSQTCSFNVVGTTSVSTTSALSDMAVGPNNKAYTIAYNSTSGQIEMRSAFIPSTNWALNAALTTTTNVKPVINIRNDGKIYVFISDGLAGNAGKVYYSTGGAFTQLGSAVSSGAVSDLSIAFSSTGGEYIAFTDGANSNYSTVKKWNGSSWVNVGTTGIASTNSGFFNSLIIDNSNIPVLAFRDFANGYKISVMKLSGSNWVPVTGTGTVSTNAATNSVLRLATNGFYYLGYTESGDVAIVQTYNGSVWAPLGSPVSGLLATANSFDFDLDPVDVPYYTAILNTAYYPTAYKYIGVPTWTTLTSGYINSSNSTNATMDIDNTGTPYFSYADVGGNNSLNVKTLASPVSISTQPLSTQIICNNAPGSFSIVTSGGTPTYQWQSATTGAFTNAGAPYVNASTNILSFTATPGINQNKLRCVVDAGCKNIISNTSTLTVSSPAISFITTNPSCFGMCNGMINSNITGGITPYTYSWNTGSTASSISALCAGTYSLSVTDNNGCTTSGTSNLFSPSGISSSISGNNTICSGNSTTLTLSASGGTPPYTFSWSPGTSLNTTTSASVVATPTANQTYTATITDANGCIKATTVTVTVNALPPVSAGADNTICSGNSATNPASGANTYTWNPGNFVGAIQNVTPLTTTTYTVAGTNTLTGCSNSDEKVIFVNSNPTITAVSNPTAICAGSSATLTASGATSYIWNPGSLTSGMIVVTPTATTVYTVTGTASGCSDTKTLSLTINANPVATASNSGTLTCTTSTVALSGGAVTGATYLWTGPSFTATTQNTSVTAPGNYTLKVTSATGCTNTAVTSVTSNYFTPIVSASVSNTLTCTNTTVSASATTTTSPVSYSWSGTGIVSATNISIITVNTAGVKTYSVTNSSNGCMTTGTLIVTQNTTTPVTTASTSGTLTCNTVTVALNSSLAGMTYSWTGPGISGSSTTQNTAANAPGIYTLLVTNSLTGCSNSATTIVTQNITIPTTTASTTGTITCTTSTVTLNSSLTGMNYTWTAPGGAFVASVNTQSTVASGTGVYSLTVINPMNGCSYTTTTGISQNTSTPAGVSAGSNQTLTCVSPSVTLNGSVLTPTNATANWTGANVCGPATTFTTSACGAGSYTLTVTNPANGCFITSTVQVSPSSGAPVVTNNPVTSNITCTNSLVTVGITTAVTPVSYAWSGSGIVSGSTTATITVTSGGSKTYTVTDTSNGCISTGSQIVMQNTTTPVTTASTTGTLTCTTLTVNLNSSLAGMSYLWSGTGITGSPNTQNTTANAAGIYTLVVTDAINGCTNSAVTSVTQNTVSPSVASSVSNSLTCSNTSVTITTSTSPTSVVYSWSGPGIVSGGTTGSPNVNQPGSYSVTVTNTINGCSSSSTVGVIADTSVPTVTLSSNTTTITCASPVTSVSINSAGSSVIYNWSPTSGIVSGTQTSSSPSFSAPGVYSVVATNTITGCATAISDNIVSVFQNITVPTLTLTAGGTNSGTLTCSTTSIVVTPSVTPASATYTWTSGAGTFSNQANVTFTSPGVYSLTVTDNMNGCISSNTANTFTVVTDIVLPLITITGNTNICNGSTTTLTGSGATFYTWDNGSNTSTISVSPSVTTTYTLTGDNGNGCISSVPVTVSIISSKSISGTITSNAGATSGDVILYKYRAALSQWDSITIVPFTTSYSFSNIDSALYVVRAIPTATNIQVTYGDSSISWQNATIINHGCSNNSNQNIKLIALENFIIGPGVLTGTITEGNGFGQKTSDGFKPLSPGTPIGGIIVKGGKNPGGQMMVQTTTDPTTGTYTLSGLPLNSGSESYFIFVDIPGLDTNGTYHIVVSAGNTQFNNLNFYVDSIYINPTSATFISEENIIFDNKIIVFPNPARQFTSIQYELIQSAEVQIEVFDIVGNKVESVLKASHQEKNKYTHKINTGQLGSGVYLIKLRINHSENVIKLIVTE